MQLLRSPWPGISGPYQGSGTRRRYPSRPAASPATTSPASAASRPRDASSAAIDPLRWVRSRTPRATARTTQIASAAVPQRPSGKSPSLNSVAASPAILRACGHHWSTGAVSVLPALLKIASTTQAAAMSAAVLNRAKRVHRPYAAA